MDIFWKHFFDTAWVRVWITNLSSTSSGCIARDDPNWHRERFRILDVDRLGEWPYRLEIVLRWLL